MQDSIQIGLESLGGRFMEPLPKRPRPESDAPGLNPGFPPQDRGGLQPGGGASGGGIGGGGGSGELECRYFNTPEGCPYGSACRFRHVPAVIADGRDVGQQTLSSSGKPRPCMKFFSTSGCPFGESCHFLHYVRGGIGSLGLTPVVSLSAAPVSATQKKATVPVGDPSITVNGYKTKLCKRFNTSEGCRFGDRCHFAHGESDLRPPNNMPRGNKRPMPNEVTGTLPPGYSSGGYSNFPNPTGYPAPPGSSSNFSSQGYVEPDRLSVAGNTALFLTQVVQAVKMCQFSDKSIVGLTVFIVACICISGLGRGTFLFSREKKSNLEDQLMALLCLLRTALSSGVSGASPSSLIQGWSALLLHNQMRPLAINVILLYVCMERCC